MKPLLLNTYDGQGGAGLATYRVHKALQAEKIESLLWVQNQNSDDHTVNSPVGIKKLLANVRPYLDALPIKIFNKNKKNELFSLAWLPNNIEKIINSVDPDIVHVFWINNGFANIEALGRIKKPTIWTLHDMWPFTGGCHYDDGCGKFKSQCGQCPSIYSDRQYDVSSWVLNRKIKSWINWDVTIVATSKWLSDQASASSLFAKRDIRVIPNPIDTEKYKPIPKKIARNIFNLPQNKKIIMFSAFGANSHPRKGGHLLQEAIKKISYKYSNDEIELVILGATKPNQFEQFTIPTHYIGLLKDEISQVILYSAVDVLVAPSMQENLSNTVLESLSCGTPVIAFDIGGMPDLIQHKFNGYLANPFDIDDLSTGISWSLLSTEINLEKISANARQSVIAKYSFPVIAKKYLDLYKSVLSKGNKG